MGTSPDLSVFFGRFSSVDWREGTNYVSDMRPDRFTQKMQEALQSAQDIAAEYSHQEITNEHFLLALLAQQDGVARPLLEKLGVAVPALEARMREDLEKRPSVTGAEHYLGSELRSVL